MYILAYKKPSYISSFKINGNSLNKMEITPVEDCVVDFGDGTKQTYTGNNTGNNSSRQVTHNYSESNTYTVQIIGNHSHFRAPETIIEIIQLSNSVTDCSDMFNYCTSLTEIPSTLIIPNSVTKCSKMFLTCTSLTTIPSTFTIPNSVTDCSDMFGQCIGLTTIPSTFTIPNSVTDCSYMFGECINLKSDISNIWPSTWNSTGTINLSNMFYECRKVTGTVPADKLWNSGKTFSPVCTYCCFFNCTSLTNYAEIPDDWKTV